MHPTFPWALKKVLDRGCYYWSLELLCIAMFTQLHEFMGFGVSKGGRSGFCSLLLLFLLKTMGLVGSFQGVQCVCVRALCVAWLCGIFAGTSLFPGMSYFWRCSFAPTKKVPQVSKPLPLLIERAIYWKNVIVFLSFFNIILPMCCYFWCVLCFTVLDLAQSPVLTGLEDCFIDIFSELLFYWEWSFQNTLK